MALFGRNKKKETDVAATSTGTAPAATGAQPTDLPVQTGRNLSGVLLNPRITEKAVGMSERNVYTFAVHQAATKRDVKAAVESIFSVSPVRVNIVNKQSRTFRSRMRGRTMSERGMKKAYVYLKAGDTINLI